MGAAVTVPRFVHASPEPSEERERAAAEAWARAELVLAAGCQDCGKSWAVHYRRGDWKGCGR